MSDRMIDNMIARVRDRSASEKRKRQEELDRRRTEALRRIGQAAIEHELGLAQSVEADKVLKVRLEAANGARISEAEAMADVAESMGDFSSRLYWWEISGGSGPPMWKGYTIYSSRQRLRLTASRDGREAFAEGGGGEVYIEITSRRSSGGGFVSELYTDGPEGPGVYSVGVSEGPGASREKAVVGAYVAFYNTYMDTHMMEEEAPENLRVAARGDDALTNAGKE
jgi:uncharacterized protein YbjQ (UPF0145 family)